MKLPTLTTRFTRSEGADNGTSRRASTVPYSPVPYFLPAQGPSPALLPVNPALLEAREIALRRKPIDQDLERNPSSEQGSFPSEDQDREVILTVGSAPTPQTPGQPVTPGQSFLPRDITNLDLRSALGTYLNYLPLVGEAEEEEVCHPPPAFITMKSNKVGIPLSFLGPSRAYKQYRTTKRSNQMTLVLIILFKRKLETFRRIPHYQFAVPLSKVNMLSLDLELMKFTQTLE